MSRERFERERETAGSDATLREHLNAALQSTERSLAMLPEEAIEARAVTHHQLGRVHDSAGRSDQAVRHYRESIRYAEAQGNVFRAGQTRFNVALLLAGVGRFSDALLYAHAALSNFQSFGERAAAEVTRARGLIAGIEEAMGGDGGTRNG